MSASPDGLRPDELLRDQFELFPPTPAPAGRDAYGIPRHIARASISPGWWQHVAPIFDKYGAIVTVLACHEDSGRLVIQASDGVDDDTLEDVLAHLRHITSQTCGCCGHPFGRQRLSPGGPTRTICDGCLARLVAGESYLGIADDHFHLDGSRRRNIAARRSSLGRKSEKRPCASLPPAELRRLIAHMRESMAAEVLGQDDAVARAALLAGLHVGGGLTRGSRALVLGSSGIGKTSLIRSMQRVLEEFDVAVVRTDSIDLTSPGWSGAPSIGDLIEAAIQGSPVDSDKSRRAVIFIDELHHVAKVAGTDGNLHAKRQEILASLLGIVGSNGGCHFKDGAEWSSEQAMVIGLGAFTGMIDLDKPVGVREIVDAGIPLELATRFAEEIIVLRPLPERALVELLRRWPALKSLRELCERLGYTVRIHDESFRRAARVITLGHDGSTPRTAGGWLLTALRLELTRALGEENQRELVVSPDSLPIPPNATCRRRGDDPPTGFDGWDTRITV